MKKTIEVCFCDICKKESEVKTVRYPLVFHTDQTKGRSCKPYFSVEKIDVCDECLKKICVVHAWGALGVNEYKIDTKTSG